MGKTLYLIHAASSPGRLVSAVKSGAMPVPWMFLSQDYVSLLRWEKALGPGFARLPSSDLLATTASELRRPFLDLIAALGRKHQSLPWWASRVSERNTAVCPLFLHCCYLKVGDSQLEKTHSQIAIVAESQALLASLAGQAPQHGYTVQWLSTHYRIWDRVQRFVRTLFRIARFTARGLYLGMLGPKTINPSLARQTVLMRTWLDERCLGPDGEFSDRYLPGLCAWLEGRGYSVIHLPVLDNLVRNYAAAWRWLASSRQQFMNPYRYYRFGDYLSALTGARQSARLELHPTLLGGMNTKGLFDEQQSACAFDNGTLESLLSHRLPLRLAQRGFNFDLFVDEYENMIPEKPLISGFRSYSPRTKLVAFQHGALYPMLLCNFVPSAEVEFAPLPDRIVCNGPFFREILIREGLPADRIVAGPALRYRHLWEQIVEVTVAQRSGIFVPLPLMVGDAVELLLKLIEAFGDDLRFSISLKPHPMSSFPPILSEAGISNLPNNFQIVSGDISQWLTRAEVVVALSSSSLYEALAAGVPIVPVGRETALDLNPLAGLPRFERLHRSARAIRDETLRLMQLSAVEMEEYRNYARQILRESFNRVNGSTLSAFVEDMDSGGRH